MKSVVLAALILLLPAAVHDLAAQERKPRRRTPTVQRPLPIKTRAQQYWTKRAEQDLTGAYPFYCSSYRTRVPLAEYQRLTRLTRFQLTDVYVTGTRPVDNGMEITVQYRFIAPNASPDPIAGEVNEVWVKDTDGTWCKPDEPVKLVFPSDTTPPRGRGEGRR